MKFEHVLKPDLLATTLVGVALTLSGCNQSDENAFESTMDQSDITSDPIIDHLALYDLAKAEAIQGLVGLNTFGNPIARFNDCGLVIDAQTKANVDICVGENYASRNQFISGYLSDDGELYAITFFERALFFWVFETEENLISRVAQPQACLAPIDFVNYETDQPFMRFDCGKLAEAVTDSYDNNIVQNVTEQEVRDILAGHAGGAASNCGSVKLPGEYNSFAEETWEEDLDNLRVCLVNMIESKMPFHASVFVYGTDSTFGSGYTHDGTEVTFWYFDSQIGGVGSNSSLGRDVCEQPSLQLLSVDHKQSNTRMLDCNDVN